MKLGKLTEVRGEIRMSRRIMRVKKVKVENSVGSGARLKESYQIKGKYISGHVQLQNRKSGQYYVKRLSDEEREFLEKGIKVSRCKQHKIISHSAQGASLKGTAVVHTKRPGGSEGGGGTNGRKPIVYVRRKG